MFKTCSSSTSFRDRNCDQDRDQEPRRLALRLVLYVALVDGCSRRRASVFGRPFLVSLNKSPDGPADAAPPPPRPYCTAHDQRNAHACRICVTI
ncbi:hypothetical protein EVAR_72597_1 [Eumeta japonica]|uniref:Uncharacterized protein n=1 Tax=Eumeta variegata TaxID=151549 RepID=A0A4C1SX16_EUMVA|nr:hypothetical protein EVAR_72597_1 [Eumeta japonica]